MVHTVDFDRTRQGRFEVGSGYFQRFAIEFHQEIIQDGQSILIADDFSGRCQQRKQRRTGYGKFHNNRLFTLIYL